MQAGGHGLSTTDVFSVSLGMSRRLYSSSPSVVSLASRQIVKQRQCGSICWSCTQAVSFSRFKVRQPSVVFLLVQEFVHMLGLSVGFPHVIIRLTSLGYHADGSFDCFSAAAPQYHSQVKSASTFAGGLAASSGYLDLHVRFVIGVCDQVRGSSTVLRMPTLRNSAFDLKGAADCWSTTDASRVLQACRYTGRPPSVECHSEDERSRQAKNAETAGCHGRRTMKRYMMSTLWALQAA